VESGPDERHFLGAGRVDVPARLLVLVQPETAEEMRHPHDSLSLLGETGEEIPIHCELKGRIDPATRSQAFLRQKSVSWGT